MEEEKKLVDFSVNNRIRDPNMHLECEATFASEFKLMAEFTNKYEYRM